MRPTFPDKRYRFPKVRRAEVTQQSRFLPFTFLSPPFFAFLTFFHFAGRLLTSFRWRTCFGKPSGGKKCRQVVEQDFHRNFWVSLAIVFCLFGASAFSGKPSAKKKRRQVVEQDFHRNFWVSLAIVFCLFGASAFSGKPSAKKKRRQVVEQDFHRNFWVSLTIVFCLFGEPAPWLTGSDLCFPQKNTRLKKYGFHTERFSYIVLRKGQRDPVGK